MSYIRIMKNVTPQNNLNQPQIIVYMLTPTPQTNTLMYIENDKLSLISCIVPNLL
jgi:hypothetical protein